MSYISRMPGIGTSTACALELRRDDADGALFANSRHQKIATACMLTIAAIVATPCVRWLAEGPTSIMTIFPAVGIAMSLFFAASILRHVLTRRELFVDRVGRRVTFRERPLWGSWSDLWTVDRASVESVTLRRTKNWEVLLSLADGRRILVDAGLQDEELRRLASFMADALDRTVQTLERT
jgi:hypothetical protein